MSNFTIGLPVSLDEESEKVEINNKSIPEPYRVCISRNMERLSFGKGIGSGEVMSLDDTDNTFGESGDMGEFKPHHHVDSCLNPRIYFRHLYRNGIEPARNWIKLVCQSEDEMYPIHKDVLWTSEMLTTAIMGDNTDDNLVIPVNVPHKYMKIILDFMYYTYGNPPELERISQPCVRPISEELVDQWYYGFFKRLSAEEWTEVYVCSEYLMMKWLSTLIQAHLGYVINGCGSRKL